MEKAAIHIYPILNEDKTKTYFMKLEIENAECKMSIFDNKNDILRNDSFEGNKWILHPITSPSNFLLARESYGDAKITEIDSVLLFTCSAANVMIFKPIKVEKRIKTPSPSVNAYDNDHTPPVNIPQGAIIAGPAGVSCQHPTMLPCGGCKTCKYGHNDSCKYTHTNLHHAGDVICRQVYV